MKIQRIFLLGALLLAGVSAGALGLTRPGQIDDAVGFARAKIVRRGGRRGGGVFAGELLFFKRGAGKRFRPLMALYI